jgi:hypothetical protein
VNRITAEAKDRLLFHAQRNALERLKGAPGLTQEKIARIVQQEIRKYLHDHVN